MHTRTEKGKGSVAQKVSSSIITEELAVTMALQPCADIIITYTVIIVTSLGAYSASGANPGDRPREIPRDSP